MLAYIVSYAMLAYIVSYAMLACSASYAMVAYMLCYDNMMLTCPCAQGPSMARVTSTRWSSNTSFSLSPATPAMLKLIWNSGIALILWCRVV